MAWKRTESETQEPSSYSPIPAGPAPPATGRRDRAVIGSSISIQGDLSGEEDLTIHGRVEGKVDVKGNSVTVGESGRVTADVYGKTIIVEGRVDGNLFGGDQIIVRSSGNVKGNLTAPRVALEDGAQFKGAIDMEPKRQARSAETGSSASGGSAAAGAADGPGGIGGKAPASGEREAAKAAGVGG